MKVQKSDSMGDFLKFARLWCSDPFRIAAIAPSSQSLANLITQDITPAFSPVIELGAGTGAFTNALLRRGIPEDQLLLVESNKELSNVLIERFPDAKVLPINATELTFNHFDNLPLCGATISGLPVLTMSPRGVIVLLQNIFRMMRPSGAVYQFTYGMSCPIPRRIIDRLGLKATMIGTTYKNIPPASVYRIARRPVRGIV